VRAAPHLALPALLLLLLSLAACEGAPAAPSTSTGTAASAPLARRLAAHDWLALGPRGVGNLGCGSGVLAWTTSSRPISEQRNRNDVVEVAAQTGGQPRVLARAQHGGTLTSALAITGSWLVYLEYQQHLATSHTDFWYLNAIDIGSGGVRELASATTGPPLDELPRYAAGDGRAFWNQLDAGGHGVLRSYDFGSGRATTLPIPAGMFPVQPVVSSGGVIFVDNSTDPERAQEDFFGRRGSLRSLDLASGQVTTLSADPTAWMPQSAAGVVVWTAISPSAPTVLSVLRLPSGTPRTLSARPVTPQTNGAIVVWYDSASLGFTALELNPDQLVRLQIGSWPDLRSVFALCGNRLYFALPPVNDGGTSTIRYADLTPLTS
jgi:hypothetical protein